MSSMVSETAPFTLRPIQREETLDKVFLKELLCSYMKMAPGQASLSIPVETSYGQLDRGPATKEVTKMVLTGQANGRMASFTFDLPEIKRALCHHFNAKDNEMTLTVHVSESDRIGGGTETEIRMSIVYAS